MCLRPTPTSLYLFSQGPLDPTPGSRWSPRVGSRGNRHGEPCERPFYRGTSVSVHTAGGCPSVCEAYPGFTGRSICLSRFYRVPGNSPMTTEVVHRNRVHRTLLPSVSVLNWFTDGSTFSEGELQSCLVPNSRVPIVFWTRVVHGRHTQALVIKWRDSESEEASSYPYQYW